MNQNFLKFDVSIRIKEDTWREAISFLNYESVLKVLLPSRVIGYLDTKKDSYIVEPPPIRT